MWWNTFESFLFVAGRILKVLKQALQPSSQGLRDTQPATAGSTWGPVGNVLGPWMTCVVACTERQESLHSGPPRQRLIPLPTMYTLYYVSGAFCGGFVVCESFSLFLGSFVPSRGVATQTLTIGIALCCIRLSLLTCLRWLQIRISFSQALNTRVPGRSFLRVSNAPSILRFPRMRETLPAALRLPGQRKVRRLWANV